MIVVQCCQHSWWLFVIIYDVDKLIFILLAVIYVSLIRLVSSISDFNK